jgi:hypothetical protein
MSGTTQTKAEFSRVDVKKRWVAPELMKTSIEQITANRTGTTESTDNHNNKS